MNKIILSLIFVFIALVGIVNVSACDVDNCTEDDMNYIVVEDDYYDICHYHENNLENIGAVGNISIDDVGLENVSAADDRNYSIVPVNNIVLAKNVKENNNNFLSNVKNDKLLAILFDPATGMIKANPNCPFMNSKYINSSGILKWTIMIDNHDLIKNQALPMFFKHVRDKSNIKPVEYNITTFAEDFNFTNFVNDFKDDCHIYTNDSNKFPYGNHFECTLNVAIPHSTFSVDYIFNILLGVLAIINLF